MHNYFWFCLDSGNHYLRLRQAGAAYSEAEGPFSTIPVVGEQSRILPEANNVEVESKAMLATGATCTAFHVRTHLLSRQFHCFSSRALLPVTRIYTEARQKKAKSTIRLLFPSVITHTKNINYDILEALLLKINSQDYLQCHRK